MKQQFIMERVKQQLPEHAVDIVSLSISRMFHRNGILFAAAISYAFLLSVVPFSTLIFLLTGTLDNLFSGGDYIQQTLVIEPLSKQLGEILPAGSSELIKNLLINPPFKKSLTIINLFFMLIVSSFVFQTLDKSYRKIFRLPPRRLFLKQTIFPVVSVLIILVFIISNFLIYTGRTVTTAVASRINNAESIYLLQDNLISAVISNAVIAVILIAFFLATVKIFLNIKLKLSHRLVSAAVFCFLWLAAKWIFTFYISYISEISVIYGSLSSIVLLLIWVFYSSLVLLFSVELMYTLYLSIKHSPKTIVHWNQRR